MASFIGPDGSSQAMRTSVCRRRASTRPPGEARRLAAALSPFEEERREALASVLHSLATEAPDLDRTAACLSLLRHLTRPARVAARP
jgi:hypothetical protein